MQQSLKLRFVFFGLLFFLMQGCVALKPYQMVYVNDPEMQMGTSVTKSFEDYAQSIREGAATPGSKKASGGCGCN